jgi:hypothetical protein
MATFLISYTKIKNVWRLRLPILEIIGNWYGINIPLFFATYFYSMLNSSLFLPQFGNCGAE